MTRIYMVTPRDGHVKAFKARYGAPYLALNGAPLPCMVESGYYEAPGIEIEPELVINVPCDTAIHLFAAAIEVTHYETPTVREAPIKVLAQRDMKRRRKAQKRVTDTPSVTPSEDVTECVICHKAMPSAPGKRTCSGKCRTRLSRMKRKEEM